MVNLFIIILIILSFVYIIKQELVSKKIKETKNIKENYCCMYCKKELKKEECNNPDDFGLHSEYINFSDKYVCNKCNLLVTITNRHLKRIIDTDYNSQNMKELENYILTINKKIDKII